MVNLVPKKVPDPSKYLFFTFDSHALQANNTLNPK